MYRVFLALVNVNPISSINQDDSIVAGKFMDILNSNRRVFALELPCGWSSRVVRSRDRGRHHKSLESCR